MRADGVRIGAASLAALLSCAGSGAVAQSPAQSPPTLTSLARQGFELKGQSSLFVQYGLGNDIKVARTIWTLEKDKDVIVCTSDQVIPTGSLQPLSCSSK